MSHGFLKVAFEVNVIWAKTDWYICGYCMNSGGIAYWHHQRFAKWEKTGQFLLWILELKCNFLNLQITTRGLSMNESKLEYCCGFLKSLDSCVKVCHVLHWFRVEKTDYCPSRLKVPEASLTDKSNTRRDYSLFVFYGRNQYAEASHPLIKETNQIVPNKRSYSFLVFPRRNHFAEASHFLIKDLLSSKLHFPFSKSAAQKRFHFFHGLLGPK